MAPLRLEEASDGTFLETTFRVDRGRMRFRLKNVNAQKERQVWRDHTHDSYIPMSQKRSTMVATLKKVEFMASDFEERWISARDKLQEFEQLGYSVMERRRACHVVGREGDTLFWVLVAAQQR